MRSQRAQNRELEQTPEMVGGGGTRFLEGRLSMEKDRRMTTSSTKHVTQCLCDSTFLLVGNAHWSVLE